MIVIDATANPLRRKEYFGVILVEQPRSDFFFHFDTKIYKLC
jgi:hypothetical protein